MHAGSRSRCSVPSAATRAPGGMEAAVLISLAGGRSPDLAARGLRDRPGRSEDNLVGGCAEPVDGGRDDAAVQGGERGGVSPARLGQHDQAFGAPARVAGGEDGDAALADSRDLADRVFELLGMEVVAGADDEVLDPAGDIQLPVVEVAEVAGVEPAVADELVGCARLAEVAGGGRGATELDAALPSVAQLDTGSVHDPDQMAWERTPAPHEPQRVRVVARRRDRSTVIHELRTRHTVDDRAAARRWEGQADAGFGEAIDRGDGVAAQPEAGEPCGEVLQRAGVHRLGAVEQHPHAAEVEPLQFGVVDLAKAQLE